MVTSRRQIRGFRNGGRSLSGMEVALVAGVIAGLLFVSMRIKNLDWRQPVPNPAAVVVGSETAPVAAPASGTQSP